MILTAGKMHASGIISEAGEKILTEKDVEAFVDAGADVILLPAPGTVPGITMEYAGNLIRNDLVHIHIKNREISHLSHERLNCETSVVHFDSDIGVLVRLFLPSGNFIVSVSSKSQ